MQVTWPQRGGNTASNCPTTGDVKFDRLIKVVQRAGFPKGCWAACQWVRTLGLTNKQ